MFANILNLELKKQRKDFLVVVGLAGAILVFFIAEAIFRNRNLAEIFKDVFGFVSIAFVFLLALTGANAGIHLRAEPYRSAEELLPFSPPQKAISAYLVNLLYFLVGASLFLITANAFGFLKQLDWIQPALFIFLIIHFHMLCFIFAYWLNHSILAIILAALVVWCEILLIKQRTFFFLFLHNPSVSFAEPVLSVGSVISLIVSFVGGLIALLLISTRIERQRNIRWIPGFVASLILITGTMLLFADLIRTSYYAQTKLWASNYGWWVSEYLDSPHLPVLDSGVYLTTNTGSIVYVRSEHRKILRKASIHLISKPNELDVATTYEESTTGKFWAIIRNDDADGKEYGIWRSHSGGELKLHSEFNSKGVQPSYLVKRENKLCLYGYTPERILYATITEKGFTDWQLVTHRNTGIGFLHGIREHLFQDKLRNGSVALLSADKTHVTRHLSDTTIQKWTLPGKGDLPSYWASVITPAFYKEGQPYFVVPVNNKGKYSLYVCNSDGSVAQLWNKSWTANQWLTWEPVPDGGQGWVLRESPSWKPIEAFVVNKTGEPNPPFKIQTTSEYMSFVDFVKKENSSLWVLTRIHLSKVDLRTGKTLKQFNIDAETVDSESIFRSRTKEGVYFVKDDRIHLIDWNGKIQDLGPATLN